MPQTVTKIALVNLLSRYVAILSSVTADRDMLSLTGELNGFFQVYVFPPGASMKDD
jgi:hypothetical protein